MRGPSFSSPTSEPSRRGHGAKEIGTIPGPSKTRFFSPSLCTRKIKTKTTSFHPFLRQTYLSHFHSLFLYHNCNLARWMTSQRKRPSERTTMNRSSVPAQPLQALWSLVVPLLSRDPE